MGDIKIIEVNLNVDEIIKESITDITEATESTVRKATEAIKEIKKAAESKKQFNEKIHNSIKKIVDHMLSKIESEELTPQHYVIANMHPVKTLSTWNIKTQEYLKANKIPYKLIRVKRQKSSYYTLEPKGQALTY